MLRKVLGVAGFYYHAKAFQPPAERKVRAAAGIGEIKKISGITNVSRIMKFEKFS
ncbi:MAG TPA: hypothetical protein PLJ84_05825 [Bacteroidales bacterium]|nr:hypothetical protein [Bacteroidales bacterium]HPT02097.1 hypothetical protein [Bacteroidales bacterium]